MITRCPYADCAHQWHYDEENSADRRSSNGFFHGRCARCQRPATLKTVDIWTQMERKVQYLGGKGGLSGGPTGVIETDSDLENTRPFAAFNNKRQLYVVLDDIRSLHNVGSIFRSSDAFGFSQIHLCGITGTPDRLDVRKTSLTAEAHIAWQYHINALQAVTGMRALGTKIISLERCDGSQDISQLERVHLGDMPLCLVLGNEVSGVSLEVLAESDLICHIPMRGMKESLNVSVAFGIAAFCLAKAVEASSAGI